MRAAPHAAQQLFVRAAVRMIPNDRTLYFSALAVVDRRDRQHQKKESSRLTPVAPHLGRKKADGCREITARSDAHFRPAAVAKRLLSDNSKKRSCLFAEFGAWRLAGSGDLAVRSRRSVRLADRRPVRAECVARPAQGMRSGTDE
jgi:hypothetical protein